MWPSSTTLSLASGALSFDAEPWVWSIDCFVSLSFSPAAIAVVLFDWSTSPSSPGLRTRIDPAVFSGLICTAVASASAFCSFLAFCPAICV